MVGLIGDLAERYIALFTLDNPADNHMKTPQFKQPSANSTVAAECSAGSRINYSMWSWSHNPAPQNITCSNTEVLPIRVKASPVSDGPCGFVDRVLWGMLIRARPRGLLSLQGSAHERRFINTFEVDLWLIEGLISFPLVFIRLKNGGKAGGFLTVGTAVPGDPLSSNWVRHSWAVAFTHHNWKPWPVVYMIALLGALIHSGSLRFWIGMPEKVAAFRISCKIQVLFTFGN